MLIVYVLFFVSVLGLPTNLRDCDYCHRNAARCKVGHVVENACVRCECSAERQYECQATSPACTDDNAIQDKQNEARCDPHNMYVLDSVTCMCSKTGFWPHDKCAAMFKSLPNPEHNHKLTNPKAEDHGEIKKTVATNYEVKMTLTANKNPKDSEKANDENAESTLGTIVAVERESCEPYSYIVKDCNVCKCNAQGRVERCTQNDCSSPAEHTVIRRNLPPAGSCVPHNWYALGPCQFCYCQQASKLVCSTSAKEHKLVSLGVYKLSDCGQGLIKELYDLGPTQGTRNNNVVKNTGQAAPAAAAAPGNAGAPSQGQVVAAPPGHILPAPSAQAVASGNTGAEPSTYSRLPPAQVAPLPPAQAAPVPPPAQSAPFPYTVDVFVPAGYASSLSQGAPLSAVNVPAQQANLPTTAQPVAVPVAKTKLAVQSNPVMLTSAGKTSNPPAHHSVPILKQGPKLEYETEYEDEAAPSVLRENDATFSPFENEEESVEGEEENVRPSYYMKQPDGSYKPVYDKPDTLRIPAAQQPSVLKQMMAQGIPKEMVQILSSMPEVSQMTEQEAEEAEQEGELESPHFITPGPKKEAQGSQGTVLRINLPTVLERLIQMALRKSMVKIDSSQSCMPGTTSKDGCNFCYCLNNGKLLCTDKKTC